MKILEINFKKILSKLRKILIPIEDGIFIYKLKKHIHGLLVQVKITMPITLKLGDSNDYH
jgi:hypothetical protein